MKASKLSRFIKGDGGGGRCASQEDVIVFHWLVQFTCDRLPLHHLHLRKCQFQVQGMSCGKSKNGHQGNPHPLCNLLLHDLKEVHCLSQHTQCPDIRETWSCRHRGRDENVFSSFTDAFPRQSRMRVRSLDGWLDSLGQLSALNGQVRQVYFGAIHFSSSSR